MQGMKSSKNDRQTFGGSDQTQSHGIEALAIVAGDVADVDEIVTCIPDKSVGDMIKKGCRRLYEGIVQTGRISKIVINLGISEHNGFVFILSSHHGRMYDSGSLRKAHKSSWLI